MSQEATPRPEVERLSKLDRVVCSDLHVTEDLDDILPYIDDRFRGPKRIMAAAENPKNDVFATSHATPLKSMGLFEGTELDYNIHDPETLMPRMAEFGLDAGVLSPSLSTNIATVRNSRFAVALMNGYNNWLLDTFLQEDNGLYGTILVSGHRPDKSAEEIDRLADEDRLVGVQLPATGLVPPPGDVSYDPIFRAAEDNDLPLCMHGVNGSFSVAFPVQRRWNQTYIENHTLAHPFSHMWNMTSMILEGVPERYPDLEFVMQEAGIAWVPYLTWRLDDEYLKRPDDAPYLEKLPSEYIAERFYFSSQPLGHTETNPKHVAQMIEMIGPDSVMFASDIPHHDFDPPWELYNRIRPHFDDETLNGIMGATAVDVFDLDLS
jgi:predicted TIM-barrel fold metal-dependent hydrolase